VPATELVVGALVPGQHLERHEPVVLRVVGAADLTHPAPADQAIEDVAAEPLLAQRAILPVATRAGSMWRPQPTFAVVIVTGVLGAPSPSPLALSDPPSATVFSVARPAGSIAPKTL